MAFGFLFLVTFSAILRQSRDLPVVSGGGNRSTRQKPPHISKSLATFLHARGVPNLDSGEGQLATSCNALDLTAIRVDPEVAVDLILTYIEAYHKMS